MKLISTLLLSIIFSSVFSQVGINTDTPNKNTLMHISETDTSARFIGKGILIPRMNQEQRDSIIISNTENEIDNGLLIYNTTEECFNYWNLAENLWSSLCGKIGKSNFTIDDCSNIKTVGDFKKNVALGSQYLELSVNVTKIGSYTITAISELGNGYYFTSSGEFHETGKFTLRVPAIGTPIETQTDLFKISLNGIEADPLCEFNVVISSKALFEMNCSTIKVNGVYKINTPLDASNTIEVTLDIDPNSISSNSMYHIETNTIDGISFRGTGLLTSTNQTVILYGRGTPSSIDKKQLVITTNSESSVLSCKVDVIVAIPKKRLLSIGTSKDGYGYNFAGSAASNKLITTNTNYGMNDDSVVKYEGWQEIIDGSDHPSDISLTNWLLKENPVDILVIGYSWVMSENAADIITQYLAKGGVVLAFNESPKGVRRLLRNIFADSSIDASSTNSAGALYNFPYSNDEILNGPFGDIRGKKWGEDASSTVAAMNLPVSEIDVYSDATNQSHSNPTITLGSITAFKHRTLHLIWVGDGGFNSNHSTTSQTICPFKLDSNNFPTFKPNYGNSTNKAQVYNAVFTANAFAWAIKKAHFDGINK